MKYLPRKPFNSKSPRRLFHLEGLEDRRLLSAVGSPYCTLPVATAAPGFIRYGAARPMASTSPVGLTPSRIRHAYGADQILFGGITGDGSGQTIAIVDAYDAPTIVQDLHTFDTTFGLPDPPSFTRINQSGGTTLPGVDPSGRGNSWAVETSLDVQWAHAMAPKANILLVEASSNYDSDLFAAINTARRWTGVSAVSLSWGGSEGSGDSAYNSYFTTPSGHNGVTFIASSGDNGAFDSGTSTRIVSYPAVSPNVVAVGGTRLSTDSSGNYLSETGWGNSTSSASLGGSGGGISRYFAQPSYQAGIVTQTSSFRAVPDLALDADPASGVAVIDSYDSPSAPWMQIGGTSLSAPLFAGVMAIVNQGRALGGQGTLDGATGTLPKLYSLSSADFHDITSGNNGYAAGPGYDLVTGRGSPILTKLVPDMVGNLTPTPVIASLAASPNPAVVGSTVTLSATGVQEINGTISSVAFYRETNGVAGLQVGSDTFVSNGAQSGTTWTTTTSTASQSAGSYTYYAVATDASNVKSGVAQTSLSLFVPTPTIGTFTISPGTVTAGTPVTLSANNVTETGGAISGVNFYRETNGVAGLQIGSDTLLGAGTQSGSNWTRSLATTGLTPGSYTCYAVASDTASRTSAASTAAFNIPVPGASNDLFANAALINGTPATVTGSNVNATKESGEPNHAGYIGGKSVWWTWTPTVSGRVSLNTRGSNFDTLLAVYTGSAVNALTGIASNDDDPAGGTRTSALTFNAVAGTTYRIAVDGYAAASGNITLNLSQAAAPVNDMFANAATISGETVNWSGSNVGASVENYEPYHAGNVGGTSVWLKWTAPSSRTVTLSTAGSNFDTLLAVYTGATLPTLTGVASNDDSPLGGTLTSRLSFAAVAGQTYYIAIDGYNGAAGAIALSLA